MQQSLQAQKTIETVHTIFGDVPLEETNIYNFPFGILGFEAVHTFLLSNIAQKKVQGASLLQPLPPLNYSFLITPFQNVHQFYEEEDLLKLCAQQKFNREKTSFYGILTPRTTEEKEVIFSVMLQGPILIDHDERMGVQGIFETVRYNKRVDLLRFKR